MQAKTLAHKSLQTISDNRAAYFFTDRNTEPGGFSDPVPDEQYKMTAHPFFPCLRQADKIVSVQ